MNVYPVPIVYTFERFRRGIIKYSRGIQMGVVPLLLSMLSGYLPDLPTITYYFLFDFSLTSFALFLIMFALFTMTYEIGYIINDNISSRKEGKFARTVLPVVSPLKSVVYSVERLCMVTLTLAVLYKYSIVKRTVLIEYAIILFLLVIVFLVYNMLSTEKRAYGFLAMLRYLKHLTIMFPVILLAPRGETAIIISMYSAVLSYYGGTSYIMKKFSCEFFNVKFYHMFLYPAIMFSIFGAPLIVLDVLYWKPVIGVVLVSLVYSILFYIGSKLL